MIKTKYNIFFRFAMLMIMMIMSAAGVWGQEVLMNYVVESTSKSGEITGYGRVEFLDEPKTENIDNTGYGFKFDRDARYAIFTTNKTIQAGDVIKYSGYKNSSSEAGLALYDKNGNTVDSHNFSAGKVMQDFSYTVTANDGIAGENVFQIRRATSTSAYFCKVTITRTTIPADVRPAEVEEYYVEYDGSILQSGWMKQTPTDNTSVTEDADGVHVVNNSDGTGDNWDLQFQINAPVALTAGVTYKFNVSSTNFN